VVFAAAAASLSSSKGQDDASEVVVSSGSMYNSNKDGGSSIPISDAQSKRGEIDPATPHSMGGIWNLFTNNGR